MIITGLSYLKLPSLINSVVNYFFSNEFQEIYHQAIAPQIKWLSWLIILIVTDLIILAIPEPTWLKSLEWLLGLLVAINVSLLGSKLLIALFDSYWLEVALKEGNKINSELLTLRNLLAKTTLILTVIFIFAQTHQINLIGLLASLGIAGAVIAFASQKILEQILWSIVLYIDRPFSVGEYIHLPDRTLGKVETIGWRSTQVRLSGKNTLVIIPNSHLAQVSIENLTRARRVILMVELTFFKAMSNEEKALIEQLILASTSDIVGIDEQLTQVNFTDQTGSETGQQQVQSQVIFFILGAAETCMELRRNLLEIAKINIIERLNTYDLTFRLEEKIVDVTQPMNM